LLVAGAGSLQRGLLHRHSIAVLLELLAHRALESAAVARSERQRAIQHRIARRRAAEERVTRFSSASDDKVGGCRARSAASGSEQSNTGSRAAVLRRSE
jgi:hypothetical protein